MISITRAALPDDLGVKLASLSKELAAVPAADRAKEARALWEKSGTRARVYRPLKSILQQMALGLEQCMYCGQDFGTDVDHFDPIARTPLRAFDWLNHLLACTTCNSNHKRDRFPTDADGRPLLIDPTMEDPFEHMTLSLSTDVYHPLSDKGIATIEVCGLNRRQLMDGRRRARNVVAFFLREWAATDPAQRGAKLEKVAQLIREQPFGDVCQAMLRQAVAPGAELIFSDAEVAGLEPDMLGYLRTSEVRSVLLR
jgi:HNH endonuclease